MHNSSHGPPSLADSAAEYFDASDDILCGSSSEVSDESGLSDGSTTNSEPEEGHGGYMKRVDRVQRGLFLALITDLIDIISFTASATRKYRASISKSPNSVVPKSTGRRTTLPAFCPDNSHVGLMAILYNNIGKDPLRGHAPLLLVKFL